MQLLQEHVRAITRRHFFGRSALGLGTAALASLLAGKPQGAGAPSAAQPPSPGLRRMPSTCFRY